MLPRSLPDVTSNTLADTPAALQWVGMEDIAVPIQWALQSGNNQVLAAKAGVYVSLDKPSVKGIHMSRLHGLVNRLAQTTFSKPTLELLLQDLVQSQKSLAYSARCDLSFEVLLKKPALLSKEAGFQAYPVQITAEKTPQGLSFELHVTIPYSSTCPCSASLSRQLHAQAVNEQFSGPTIEKDQLIQWLESPQGTVATPHSQRSYAYIQLCMANNEWPDVAALIFELEKVIGTPVQTAVKRVDEQAFAKLNAENLMFCEDAARRIKCYLERLSYVDDYAFKVEHQESLHAHNAVVIDKKYSMPIKKAQNYE